MAVTILRHLLRHAAIEKTTAYKIARIDLQQENKRNIKNNYTRVKAKYFFFRAPLQPII